MSAQNRTHRSEALLATLLLFALGACTSTPRGSQNSYEGREGGQMNAVEGNQILARNLAIKNPIHKREGGRMVVQFDLENRRSTATDFAWAVDWFDRDGFAVRGATRHWEPVSLGGYGSTTLTVVAPTPDASSWKLQVTSRNEVK
jgi:uncharacterized protein YcfL